MGPSITKSAIDKLGKRLASEAPTRIEDLRALSALQGEFSAALSAASTVVEGIFGVPSMFKGRPLRVAHRVKTVNTLIDKLRRGTALSRMRDIGGMRIVGREPWRNSVTWFLLVYHRVQRQLLSFRQFSLSGRDLAWKERERLIEEHVGDPNVEVVLLGARSEAELRETHQRYFSTAP